MWPSLLIRIKKMHRTFVLTRRRAVGAGWAEGPRDRGSEALPPDFGRSVNPIQTRGQVMPNTLLLATFPPHCVLK